MARKQIRVYLNSALLKNNPLGLESIKFNLDRDDSLFGIYAVTILNLIFIGDGYCKLYDFQQSLTECEMTIKIDISCSNGQFKTIFNGIIPIASVNLDVSIQQAKVEIEDNSPLALISRNSEINFDYGSTNDIFGAPLVNIPNYVPIDVFDEVANYSTYPAANGLELGNAIESIVNFMTGYECEFESDFLFNTTPVREQWKILFSAIPGTDQITTVRYKNYYGQIITKTVTSTGNQHISDIVAMLRIDFTTSPSSPDEVREAFRNYDQLEFQFTNGNLSPYYILAESVVPFKILSVETTGTATVSFSKEQVLVDAAQGIHLFDWGGLHGEDGKINLTFKNLITQINKATGCSFFAFFNRQANIVGIRLEPDSYFLSLPISQVFDNVKEVKSEINRDFTYDKIKVGSSQSQNSRLNLDTTFSSPFCGINSTFDADNDFIVDSVQIWVDLAVTYDPSDVNDNIYMIQAESGQAIQYQLATSLNGVSSGTLRFYNNYLTNNLSILRFMSRFKTDISGSPDKIIENIAPEKILRSYLFTTYITEVIFKSFVDAIPDRISAKRSEDINYRTGLIKSIEYDYWSGKANFTILTD